MTTEPNGFTGLVVATACPHQEPAARGRWLAEQLERGQIVCFPPGQFTLEPSAQEFLLAQRQTAASYHKNIAYRPRSDRLTGADTRSPAEAERLRAILRDFSRQATDFVAQWLAPYAASGAIRLDFASFRPLEEHGRQLRLRARNDLLHTDAFPTRPTCGDRILRFFVNLNPTRPRVWATSETFGPLVRRYGKQAGLEEIAQRARSRVRISLRRLARQLGWRVASPYDRFMLRFHHFLKENADFQQTAPRQQWQFAPGTAWMVYTDMVSHAVLSGQFALEQTFLIDHRAMLEPVRCPAGILEQLTGVPLTDQPPLLTRSAG